MSEREKRCVKQNLRTKTDLQSVLLALKLNAYFPLLKCWSHDESEFLMLVERINLSYKSFQELKSSFGAIKLCYYTKWLSAYVFWLVYFLIKWKTVWMFVVAVEFLYPVVIFVRLINLLVHIINSLLYANKPAFGSGL
mgnify:CR=1 FL=1